MTLGKDQTRQDWRWRSALGILAIAPTERKWHFQSLKMFDTRRHLRHGRRSRRAVQVGNDEQPPTVAVATDLNQTAREPNPAGYGFSGRDSFLRWKVSMLRQLDPGQR
jgi:hypothetical protein